MGWRPHGHVRVNARSPRAAGVCDRCGRMFNHDRLQWQWDWRGNQLQNLRILVCESCVDVPQQQLRPRIIPPDPLPVYNARPEPFTFTGISYQETNFLATADEIVLAAADGVTLLVTANNNPGPPL